MITLQDDQYWTISFQNGEDNALAHFFKLHNRSLYYFARQMVQDDEEAEDIVADCLLKLWERRKDFDTAANIKSFLFISCRNACLDYLKHLKVKSVAQQVYFSKLSHSEDTILYTIMESEFLDILNREIDLLPEKCRQIFKLIYFEGKKTDEIAKELDLSVQTVRNQKTRAVELLRTVFLKKGMSNAFSVALLLFAGKN